MYDASRRLLRSRSAIAGVVVLAILILLAIMAPLISSYDPTAVALRTRLQPPSASHLFGTDEFGRDILTRVFYGARISLPVGLIALAIGVSLGTLVGLIAGFYGKCRGRLPDVGRGRPARLPRPAARPARRGDSRRGLAQCDDRGRHLDDSALRAPRPRDGAFREGESLCGRRAHNRRAGAPHPRAACPAECHLAGDRAGDAQPRCDDPHGGGA